MQHLLKRAGWWYYQRRVPTDYRALDPRNLIQQSTKVRVADDPRGLTAAKVAMHYDDAQETYWRDLIAGRDAGARKRLKDTIQRARQLGFQYRQASEIAGLPLAEILTRLEALERQPGLIDDTTSRQALLGALPTGSSILVSEVFEHHYQRYVAHTLLKKSEEQKHKWAAPFKRAVSHFLDIVGDKDIAHITRADALRFWTWWDERITGDGMDSSQGIRECGNWRRMLDEVLRKLQLPENKAFDGLSFKKTRGNKRPPFSNKFIQERLLAPGAFASLNDEARDIFYVFIETGMRPSEIIGLNRQHIHLDAKVPHVSIEEHNRELKTQNSIRTIPLVGVALAVMKRNPDGFAHYRDEETADAWSACVGKHLEVNKLKETDRHVAYCLRHSFKDRLRAARAPEEMIDALMGHTNDKPDYGTGYTLEQKQKVLHRIAFKTFPSIA